MRARLIFVFLFLLTLGSIVYAAGGDPAPSNGVALVLPSDNQTTALYATLGGTNSTTIATLTSTTTGEIALAEKTASHDRFNRPLRARRRAWLTCSSTRGTLPGRSPTPGGAVARRLRRQRSQGPSSLAATASATDPGVVWTSTQGATHARLVVTTTATTGTEDLWPGTF